MTGDSALAGGPRPHVAQDEPLFGDQWYLDSLCEFDINILPVLPDYTGAGVTIGIMDECIQLNHPDLQDNILTTLQIDGVTGDTGSGEAAPQSSTEAHGTAVAGVAAVVDNNIGIVGVAHKATPASLHLPFDERVVDYDALFSHAANVDVWNNSWGYPTSFAFPFNDNFSDTTIYPELGTSFAAIGALVQEWPRTGAAASARSMSCPRAMPASSATTPISTTSSARATRLPLARRRRTARSRCSRSAVRRCWSEPRVSISR